MIWIKSRKTYLNFSLRCDECSDLRLDWQKLSRNLKDQGMGDVVVSQVNCCIEHDLCDTFDRQTKCLDTIKNRGNVERYPFHYEINSQNLNYNSIHKRKNDITHLFSFQKTRFGRSLQNQMYVFRDLSKLQIL